MERLLDYFVPEKYRLTESFWRENETFNGTVEIIGQLQIGNHSIKLHAVDMEVDCVEWFPCDIGDDDPDYFGYEQCDFTYRDGVIEIPISDDMQHTLDELRFGDNRISLRIRFRGFLNHNMQGCYLSSYDFNGEQQRLIATQFESHYAREAFPCIDEPAAKAVFELTLVVPDYDPSRDVVLANTPIIGQVNGKFDFASTPCMSTYLLAWVIGPLQSISTVNKNGVRISSYCALNQPLESLLFANETAARALEYYDEKFQEKYPLPKLDQVALPDFEAGAMENWGLVTYRESMMLADKTATIDTKRTIAVTVTHELSHQWFGDLVTMKWWDDLWLNESFATIMEYYATDTLYPDFDIWQDFFTSDCLIALRRDCLPCVQAVKQEVRHPAEIATLFDSAIVYAKGARLILMLIRMMGEEKFDQGIRDYFDRYKYQNTVGDDLWHSLQPYADFDVTQFMNAWIDQPGYPLVTLNGQQKRFLIDDGLKSDEKWPLPKIRDDMSGHYLINLNSQEFQQKLDDFDRLSLEQQLRLLIDREFLAKTSAVSSSSLLELLQKFTRNNSAAVWEVVTTLIADLKLFCPVDTPYEEDYQIYLRQLFREQLDQVNYKTIADIDELSKRNSILNIAGCSEDPTVLQHLREMYHNDLRRIDPELRGAILVAKIFYDETDIFDDWIKKYCTETDPELKFDLLFALAKSSRDPKHIAKLVEWLDKPEIVRPQDHLYLYIYLLRNHYAQEVAFKWLVAHWDYVKQLTGDKSIEDYVRATASVIHTPEAAKSFSDFFDPKADDPAIDRAVKMAHTDINARLRLISEDAEGVRKKLRLLTKGE